jgi:hypothetical protein
MSKEEIIISEQELFNLILDTHIEIEKLGTTGLVNTGKVIMTKIKEHKDG